MVRCNDVSQLEVHLSYDFTNNEWNRLPEAEIIMITEEMACYKRSRTNRYVDDTRSVPVENLLQPSYHLVATQYVSGFFPFF